MPSSICTSLSVLCAGAAPALASPHLAIRGAANASAQLLAADADAMPVVELYMYRSRKWADTYLPESYATENANLADIAGGLQYMMREIIVDSRIGRQQEDLDRKYAINAMIQYRVKVRNPAILPPEPQHMDFEAFVTYDYGQATNRASWAAMHIKGDSVGIQPQEGIEAFVPFDSPSWWFSFNGFCPSLSFQSEEPTAMCPTIGTCEEKSSPEPGCLDPDPASTAAPKQCLCYGDQSPAKGERITGGLCGESADRETKGAEPPTKLVDPTGGPGCTYSYEPYLRHVYYDDVIGLKDEDCGGRKCADFADFRQHCTNPKLKRRFKTHPGSEGEIYETPFCVEYDAHPACFTCDVPPAGVKPVPIMPCGCDREECKALKPEERELGLPFWQGRCDAEANLRRVERIANAFGIKDAMSKHQATLRPDTGFAPCRREEVAPFCNGNPMHGEVYCTREWGGVCARCRIPGAEYPNANLKEPRCPYNIMQGEYNTEELKVKCKTKDARDICCLYNDECGMQIAIAAQLVGTLHLDGDEGLDALALILASQDTMVILEFYKRLVIKHLGKSNNFVNEPARHGQLYARAYWDWNINPLKRLFVTHAQDATHERITMQPILDELAAVLDAPVGEADWPMPQDIPTPLAPTVPPTTAPGEPTAAPSDGGTTAAPNGPDADQSGGAPTTVTTTAFRVFFMVTVICVIGIGIFLAMDHVMPPDPQPQSGSGAGAVELQSRS